jgi:Gpi18-like mannosyltransferase
MSLFLDKQGRSKIPLAKSRLFWAGVIIKVIISIGFASTYMSELFAPFSNYFIGSGFDDPYNYFVANGKGNAFPYPPLMLWLFSLPRAILWPLLPGSAETFTVWDSLLYRIPLMIADFAILIVLIRWLKTRTRQVLIWYWLSPVLIYINYFHGQLDVIPMALMISSLYLLFKNKWTWAFVFTGLAISCKTNMVLVVPFYGLYLLRASQVSIKTIVLSVIGLLLPIILINAPYMNSQGMLQMVYNNPVQQQIFDLYYQFNQHLRIYFIPAIYFTLVLYYFTFRFVNRDQLVLFLAFTFLALTLMIAPMQGWYYWIMPLLVYFVIKQSHREKYMLVLLSVLYFVYFGLIQDSDYLVACNFISKDQHFEGSGKALNIAFTLLQTTLLLLAYLVFKNGIGNNIQSKFLSQPYMIGIGGDSASGKSTLSNALSDVFEQHNTSIIRGDDMHKWERGNENWNVYTHLDPRANKLHEDLEHARELKLGRSIKRRKYRQIHFTQIY